MIEDTRTALLICSMACAFLLPSASAAGDSDWRVYSKEANGDVHFFDPSRVEETREAHRVWIRIQYKTSVMGASSYQSLMELDCSARTERILQRTFFSDDGWEKPAMNTDFREKPKRPIAEGSASARLSEIVCGS